MNTLSMRLVVRISVIGILIILFSTMTSVSAQAVDNTRWPSYDYQDIFTIRIPGRLLSNETNGLSWQVDTSDVSVNVVPHGSIIFPPEADPYESSAVELLNAMTQWVMDRNKDIQLTVINAQEVVIDNVMGARDFISDGENSVTKVIVIPPGADKWLMIQVYVTGIVGDTEPLLNAIISSISWIDTTEIGWVRHTIGGIAEFHLPSEWHTVESCTTTGGNYSIAYGIEDQDGYTCFLELHYGHFDRFPSSTEEQVTTAMDGFRRWGSPVLDVELIEIDKVAAAMGSATDPVTGRGLRNILVTPPQRGAQLWISFASGRKIGLVSSLPDSQRWPSLEPAFEQILASFVWLEPTSDLELSILGIKNVSYGHDNDGWTQVEFDMVLENSTAQSIEFKPVSEGESHPVLAGVLDTQGYIRPAITVPQSSTAPTTLYPGERRTLRFYSDLPTGYLPASRMAVAWDDPLETITVSFTEEGNELSVPFMKENVPYLAPAFNGPMTINADANHTVDFALLDVRRESYGVQDDLVINYSFTNKGGSQYDRVTCCIDTDKVVIYGSDGSYMETPFQVSVAPGAARNDEKRWRLEPGHWYWIIVYVGNRPISQTIID